MNPERRWGLMGAVPIAASIVLIAVGEASGWPLATARWLSLLLLALCVAVLIPLRRAGRATAINLSFGAFMLLAAAGFWFWPGGLGRAVTAGPIAWVYWVLLAGASLPWVFGAPPFTEVFAKRTTPEAVWQTDIFKRINRNMTLVWCLLFLAAALVATLAILLPASRAFGPGLCTGVIPVGLMLGIGLPFTKTYPAVINASWAWSRLAEAPPAAEEAPALIIEPTPAPAPAPRPIREETMSGQKTIVAVNGSPHGGIGNTAQIDRDAAPPPWRPKAWPWRSSPLHDKEIDYCTGCAVCLEKGKMLDSRRSSGLGEKAPGRGRHHPGFAGVLFPCNRPDEDLHRSQPGLGAQARDTYKPGLAISVAAVFQEVEVADYLSNIMHAYGAFPVGTFTAMAPPARRLPGPRNRGGQGPRPGPRPSLGGQGKSAIPRNQP